MHPSGSLRTVPVGALPTLKPFVQLFTSIQMKKYIFFSAIIALCTLASCSDDGLAGPVTNPTPAQADDTGGDTGHVPPLPPKPGGIKP